jgi:hypothetical protein
MPPNQPLSLENRTIIRLWIEQGAGLTVCPETTGTGGDSSGGGGTYVNPRACFTRDILPVVVSRCATTKCHDAVTHKEGYIFASYTTTMKAVSPGNPGGSKLYKVIKLAPGEEKMPPSGSSQLSTSNSLNMKRPIIYLATIALFLLFFVSCYYDNEEALYPSLNTSCDTMNVTYSVTIALILSNNCTGCHSGATPSGAISLTSYANVVAKVTNVAGSIKHTGTFSPMPPGNKLKVCSISQFDIWVRNGMPNN